MDHDELNGGYQIHHCRPTTVEVAPIRRPAVTAGDLQTAMYDMSTFFEENTRRRLDVELEFMAGAGI